MSLGTQYITLNLSGSPAKAKVRRDTDRFPLTSQGFADLKADLESATARSLDVSLLNSVGGVIRVLPAMVQPSPAWINGLRYSYASPLLTIESGDTVDTLSFSRADGTSFQTTNPDGVTINSGHPYSSGPGVSPYTKRWQINYTGPTLQITAKRMGSSEAKSFNLTPANGASHVVLFGSSLGGGSENPGGGGDGTTFSLNNKPTFDTFDYEPITSNPTWPNTFDTRAMPTGEASPGGQAGQYAELSNEFITVRVYKRFGATPAYVAPAGSGNFIQMHDLGTMDGLTLYRGGLTSPNPNATINSQWAPNPTQPYPNNGTGNDPIQMGDTYGFSSEVVAIGRNDTTIYTKTLMKNWPVQNEQTDAELHQWIRLDGRAAKVNHLVRFNRTDTAFYDAREQEYPTFYSIYESSIGAYYGPGGLTYKTSDTKQSFNLGKPFMAMMPGSGSGDVGIALYGQGNYKTSHSRNDYGGGGDLGNSRGQSTMAVGMHIDHNCQIYGSHAWIVGTISQIESWVTAQGADPRNTMEWEFNSRNGRGWFTYGKGKDSGYPTPDTGIVLMPDGTGSFIDLHWPAVAIPSGSANKVYMRYKSNASWPSSGVMKIGLLGESNSEAHQANFSLTCDNTWRTVEIDFPSVSGTISNPQLTWLDPPNEAVIEIKGFRYANTW